MRDIRAVAREIAMRFRPLRIVLFGSYAYGTADRNSDVDFLILMRGRSVHDRALTIRREIDFPFPVDLLVRSEAEFKKRLKWGDQFLREIQDKGKVLYESVGARPSIPDRGSPASKPKTRSRAVDRFASSLGKVWH